MVALPVAAPPDVCFTTVWGEATGMSPEKGPLRGVRPLSFAIWWFMIWDMRELYGTCVPY